MSLPLAGRPWLVVSACVIGTLHKERSRFNDMSKTWAWSGTQSAISQGSCKVIYALPYL